MGFRGEGETRFTCVPGGAAGRMLSSPLFSVGSSCGGVAGGEAASGCSGLFVGVTKVFLIARGSESRRRQPFSGVLGRVLSFQQKEPVLRAARLAGGDFDPGVSFLSGKRGPLGG